VDAQVNSITNSKGQVDVDEEGRSGKKTNNIGKAAGGVRAGHTVHSGREAAAPLGRPVAVPSVWPYPRAHAAASIEFASCTVMADGGGPASRAGSPHRHHRLLRHPQTPPARIIQALGVREGDPLPASKASSEEKLETVPGVTRALLEAVCCDNGKTVLFVGIEERLARHSEFRPDPEGDAKLPQNILDAYGQFQETFQEAVRYGKVVEGFAEGHPLFSDLLSNQAQKRFIGLAEENLPKLREVLRSSADADQRAIAAEVIGYAPKKQMVVDDLQYALQDPTRGFAATPSEHCGPSPYWPRRNPHWRSAFHPPGSLRC